MIPTGRCTVIASASKLAYPSACDYTRPASGSASAKITTRKIQQRNLRFSVLLLIPLVSSCMLESQVQEQLRVQVSVDGSGLVTAENSSINCHMDVGALCDVVYNNANSDTFHASDADDWEFVKWLGYPPETHVTNRPTPRAYKIFVDCSLETAEERDPKGLYKKARAGEIKNFTGIDDPYEAPPKPEIHLHSDQQSLAEELQEILSVLRERGIISQ